MDEYRKKHTGLWRISLEKTEDQAIINTIKNDGTHHTVNEILQRRYHGDSGKIPTQHNVHPHTFNSHQRHQEWQPSNMAHDDRGKYQDTSFEIRGNIIRPLKPKTKKNIQSIKPENTTTKERPISENKNRSPLNIWGHHRPQRQVRVNIHLPIRGISPYIKQRLQVHHGVVRL